MVFFGYLLLATVALSSVGSERILAVIPFFGRSHFFVYQSVLEELARRGHDVTVISQFPKAKPMNRYTDINVENIGRPEVLINLKDYQEYGLTLQGLKEEVDEQKITFEKVFKDERIINLLNSTIKFDLVMTEIFLSDMFVGISHVLKAPLVEMISSVVIPWASDRFAIPDNPSYIRTYIDTGAGPMSFYERIHNSFVLLLSKLLYYYYITLNDERVSETYLGKNLPPLKEMMKKTSLFLVNSHFSVNGARPFPPQVVEIGGVHIKPAKPLSQELEKFINESEHGVIYFSLGSIVNVSSMPDDMRKAFCNNFAKLKQRVLWKWELDEMPEKPDNVKIVKWMPQGDVLAHPNVKIYIGHGGLLGTMEAVYNAVPMIGIPIFADQYQNIANLVNAGSAVLLNFEKITEESISTAINTILKDTKYKTNVQHLSKLFKDRPVPPMDTAIYWIEYVMKHKGAHHLRTAAVDLPWYQYLLLDVIAAFILFVILLISVLIYVIKLVIRKMCVKRKEKTH